MPLYDCRNLKPDDPFYGKYPNAEKPLPGSIPFPDGWNGTADANGKVLSPLLWANTETGEVGRYSCSRVNGSLHFDTDPETKLVIVKNETHPAPLRKATADELKAASQGKH